MKTVVLLSIYFSLILAGQANAYVGPGLGVGTIGTVLGVIGSIFLVLLAIVWYPIKRLIKKRTSESKEQSKDKNGVSM